MATPITITSQDISADYPNKTVKILTFSGQLDESNVDDEAKKIYKVIESTPKNLFLIFDFSNLGYLNSKSIGYLTDWYSRVIDTEGKMILAGLLPNVEDILNVVGLTQIMEHYATLDEAKVALK